MADDRGRLGLRPTHLTDIVEPPCQITDCGCKYCVLHNEEADNCGFVGKPLCVCNCEPPEEHPPEEIVVAIKAGKPVAWTEFHVISKDALRKALALRPAGQ